MCLIVLCVGFVRMQLSSLELNMLSSISFCTEGIIETLPELFNSFFSLCHVFLVVFSLGITKAHFADPGIQFDL